MTSGPHLFFAVGSVLNLPAAVEIAGVELETLGVILVIIGIVALLALGFYSLLIFLFFLGSGR